MEKNESASSSENPSAEMENNESASSSESPVAEMETSPLALENASAETENNENTSPSSVARKAREMLKKDSELRMAKKNLEDTARNADIILLLRSFFLQATYAYWHSRIHTELWSLIPVALFSFISLILSLFVIASAWADYSRAKTRFMQVSREATRLAETRKLLRQEARNLMDSLGSAAGGIPNPYGAWISRIANSDDLPDIVHAFARSFRFLKLKMVLAFAPVLLPFAPIVGPALCAIVLLMITLELFSADNHGPI